MAAKDHLSPQQLSLGIGEGTAQYAPAIPWVAEGARSYAQSQGLDHDASGLDILQVDSQRGFKTYNEYDRSQATTPSESTRASYAALRDETSAQYDHLTRPVDRGGMGVSVEVTPDDPYGSPRDLHEDLSANRRIKVMSTATTGGHSFFTDEENDKFRAVHDVFGHTAIGRGFSRDGEEAAYRSHRQMYTPAAREALTSETRGQNSYLNFGGGEFPENAVVGMSEDAQSLDRPTPHRDPKVVSTSEQRKLF